MAKNKKTETEQVVAEDEAQGVATDAAKTLAPNPPRSEQIADLLGQLNSLDASGMLDFFNKTMAQFGPGKTYGVGDNSAQNAASVQTHNPIKEALRADVEDLFSGDQALTEEFKTKASTLFEAAINARVEMARAKLIEEYDEKLEAESEEIYMFLTEKIDDYVSLAAQQWLEDNQVAIDGTLKNELSESFMEGIKSVFADHYIEVPEAKVDVVAELAARVEDLEAKLNETLEANIALSKMVDESEVKKAVDGLCEGLSVVQSEKLRALASGVDFEGDMDEYNKKLGFIRETVVSGKDKAIQPSNILTEEFDGQDDKKKVVYEYPEMSRYVAAISRTATKS